MNAIFISIRYLIVMTFLLGGVYPLAVMLIGQNAFPIKSNGSLLTQDGVVIGSELLSQNFARDDYFWSRPSAADHNPASSSATNQSGTSKKLKADYLERKDQLKNKAPNDLLHSSASGLDPHISVEAAQFQKPRVMANRALAEKKIDEFILKATEERFLGFMGQPRVNVLKLNLMLDQ